MAYAGNSVYWVGADGNVYLKNGTNVRNVGSPINLMPNGFDSKGVSAVATRINDPNPPAASAPANPNNTGSGSSGTQPADKSNDIALQNAGLGAVDSQTAAGIAAVDKALGSLTGQYDTEATSNEGNYKTQSDTNQNNLQANKQTALVNAVQGRQGLFGTLASLGALNGSGIDLANRAVQQGANADLTGAAGTYATNQSGLDTSINAFRTADKERRQQAATAAEDAKTNVQNEGNKSKQAFYSNLANDYAAEGDSGNAKKYTDLASSLYPSIASTNVPSTNLGYTGAAYTPSTLASYLSTADNTTVATPTATNGQGLPGLVATNRKKAVATA